MPKAWTYYLQVNQRGRPLANQKLREAISLAINRQELTSKVLADGSMPASSFVSPGTAVDPTSGQDFSKETSFSTAPKIHKARSLLAAGKKEAGISGDLKLSIVGDDQDVTKNVAQYLQGQLAAKLPGVKVSIANIPDKAQQARRSEGKFDLAQWYWLADFGDPINYLGILTTNNTMNPGKFSDATYDSLIERAKTADNQTDFWNYLRQAEKRLMNQNGIIPLYYVRESHLVNPKLSGVEYHVAGFPDYTRATIGK
ncbi:ABC transporter substrate-binding protein [Lentilactobacillus parakefiri]|uniref:Peptide ABC transporter substrate-binding protein n=1 Tax=Lentilactobacillus parakefiri TaxID=152332 RepID=A0A224VE82_9LACO|nr:ABC transporter substrate-binding protein [Lentilactobacillus parakefiri]TDG94562.1 hypothetical protein C5L28_000819 [Lentilactobacillus parakefiri]GAW72189.1 peptide ABC transporter substrate-binding protein [Lentilactobacillus parakefiri]